MPRAGPLLDTQVWVWSLLETARSIRPARPALSSGSPIFVGVVTVCEITHKAGLGRWSEMKAYASNLPGLATGQGGTLLDVTASVAVTAGSDAWTHRYPFDRMIAATSRVMGLPLVSSDPAFDTVPGGLHRVW